MGYSSEYARLWGLDPDILFLNHGSFGACPKAVLAFQGQLRDEMEREPVQFFVHGLAERLFEARDALASFVGANPTNLVFVPNATTGVNTILRSIDWRPGDEILVTDHGYPACNNAVVYVAKRCGLQVAQAKVPFPVQDEDAIVSSILDAVTPKTRLALIDHITSPTALVLPIQRIVKELNARGVDTLVDGAHAPGQVNLDLEALGAAYYTGNCHKWMCTPKGSALLYVRPDKQAQIAPLATSHGHTVQPEGRNAFECEFLIHATADVTPYLCVPKALEFFEEQIPGGWNGLRERNHQLAIQARNVLCDALEVEPPCPATMLGSMARVALPGQYDPAPPLCPHPIQQKLFDDHHIEVQLAPWPTPTDYGVRVSAQAYNTLPQYEALGQALREVATG